MQSSTCPAASSRDDKISNAKQRARAGMFGFFFSEHPITCFEDASKYSNSERFAKYHRAMLEHGVYTAPSMYEAGFTSLAHTDAQIDKTLEAYNDVFSQL